MTSTAGERVERIERDMSMVLMYEAGLLPQLRTALAAVISAAANPVQAAWVGRRKFVMSTPDAGDELLALRTDAARTRTLAGVCLGAQERAALERIVLYAASTVDEARALTGADHHSDLPDRVGELIAPARQAERRANP